MEGTIRSSAWDQVPLPQAGATPRPCDEHLHIRRAAGWGVVKFQLYSILFHRGRCRAERITFYCSEIGVIGLNLVVVFFLLLLFWKHISSSLCAKLLMVRTMLQSTKTFDTKLVRYIEWSNVQPCVHHISPIWPHYGHFGPKNSHIWPYLAIGSPSCPKLVEHWLNMVEHRSPHLGWATWTPLHSPK